MRYFWGIYKDHLYSINKVALGLEGIPFFYGETEQHNLRASGNTAAQCEDDLRKKITEYLERVKK